MNICMGGARPTWTRLLAATAMLAFSTAALAEGDILSLRGDDGAFGIASVGNQGTCTTNGEWIGVLVGVLAYGNEIEDGDSRSTGENFIPPTESGKVPINAERICEGSGQPGQLLRGLTTTGGTNPDFTFGGGAVVLSQTTTTYTGTAGSGDYKIRAPIGAPEPGTLALVAAGFGAAGIAARRRRNRKG